MTGRERLLIALAAGLLALAAWQYWPMGDGEAPLSPETAPAGSGDQPVPGPNPLAGRAPADLGALAAHPLFAPSRTPPSLESPPESMAESVPDPAAEAAPPPEVAPSPVLQGVVLTPAPGGVFLGDDQGGESRFLRPGQAAMGLSLEEVFADRATFMGPEGEVTLPLVQAPPPAPPVDGTEIPPAADQPAEAGAEGLSPDAGEQDTTIPGLAAP